MTLQSANRLKNNVRDSDIVARLGGDKFTIILPMSEDIESVERLTSKLLSSLTNAFCIKGLNNRGQTTALGLIATISVRTLILIEIKLAKCWKYVRVKVATDILIGTSSSSYQVLLENPFIITCTQN